MGKYIFIVVLIFLFIGVTILNTKTKVPDGVEIPDKCNGCSISSCGVKQKGLTKEAIEQIKNDINCEKQKEDLEDDNER